MNHSENGHASKKLNKEPRLRRISKRYLANQLFTCETLTVTTTNMQTDYLEYTCNFRMLGDGQLKKPIKKRKHVHKKIIMVKQMTKMIVKNARFDV